MLHEICRRFVHINKHEEPTLCWRDSVLCLQANKHLTFFDFSYNLQSLEKRLNFIETTVKYPLNSPVSSEFLNKYLKKNVKNFELVEMITNPSFWPHSPLLKSEMGNIKSSKCSPAKIIYHSQNIVALVNSFGNVDFLASNRCAYSNILNFTTIIKDTINFYDVVDEPHEIEKVKEIVYQIHTSAICWAPTLNDDNSCYFITVQKSGHIMLWSITTELKNVQVQYYKSFNTNDFAEMEDVLWINIDNNQFLLIVSNNLGQIIKYKCVIENKQIKLINQYFAWEIKDRMIAKNLHYLNCDDKIFFICNKNRHLIIHLYDLTMKLLSQNIFEVNDEKITSIVKSKDDIYVGTINTKLYKLNIQLENNDIKVIFDPIGIKENFSNYELYGIGTSPNNAIVAFALKDQKLFYRKEVLKVEVVFFSYYNELKYEFNNIINNPSQDFTDVWEYIELLRCKIMRNKTIPDFDYNHLYLESTTSLYKLKVYYVILIFYKTLRMSKTVSLINMPNTNVDEIKENILLLQAVTLVNSIHKKYENKKLNDSEIEYFAGAKRYLLYYCKKYNKQISELVRKDIFSTIDCNKEYICHCCENMLEEFSCKLGHWNMFCTLTFTPIDGSDYLICKICGATARHDLYADKPKCIFCDVYFIYYDMIL